MCCMVFNGTLNCPLLYSMIFNRDLLDNFLLVVSVIFFYFPFFFLFWLHFPIERIQPTKKKIQEEKSSTITHSSEYNDELPLNWRRE